MKHVGAFFVFAVILVTISGCGNDMATEPMPFASVESIAVIAPEEMQGKTGHLIEFLGTDGSGTVMTEAALAVRDTEVSDAVFYILIGHTSANGTTEVDETIRLLAEAEAVALVDAIPKGYAPIKTVWIGEGTPQVSHYLRIRTKPPTRDVYILVHLVFSQAHYDGFLAMVAKGPQIIGGVVEDTETTPAFTNWLNSDPTGQAPPPITEVRYVVASSTEPDIAKVREQQEILVRSAYGDNYQNDDALHRALRVVDRIE